MTTKRKSKTLPKPKNSVALELEGVRRELSEIAEELKALNSPMQNAANELSHIKMELYFWRCERALGVEEAVKRRGRV